MNKDFLDMLRALSEAGAKFLVVGAYAVTAHAEPRSTNDIDLWVEASPGNATLVYKALQAFGAPLQNLQVEELESPGLIYQIGIPPVRIDILTAIDGVDFAEAWENKATLAIGKQHFPLIGRSQLLRNKRAAGRPKDLLDIELIEKHGPK